MPKKELEIKINEEKKRRKEEIVEKLFIILSVIILIWIIASWGEVIHHNDAWFNDNILTSYSWWNLFRLIVI